jgi:uncharacterized protein (DUF169 family)
MLTFSPDTFRASHYSLTAALSGYPCNGLLCELQRYIFLSLCSENALAVSVSQSVSIEDGCYGDAKISDIKEFIVPTY